MTQAGTLRTWVTDTVPSARYPIHTRLETNDVMADPVSPMGCIAGVADATWRVRDGATLEVDGSTGRVTALSR